MDLLSAAIIECVVERLPGMVKIVAPGDNGIILAQRGHILNIMDDCVIENNSAFNEVLASIKHNVVPIIAVRDGTVSCGTYNSCFDVYIDPNNCRFQDTVDEIVRKYGYFDYSLINDDQPLMYL